jgi:glycosyltransferase involved in cell wall biosynthesis
MRAVIDLLDSLGEPSPAVLSLLRDMAKSAGGRELWIAMPLRAPRAIETVRLALDDMLPPSRVRTFAIPPAGRIADLVRQHALAGLAPDAVLLIAGPGRRGAAPGLPTIIAEAREASAANLWLQLAATAAERPPERAAPARKKLAYVSPLPPVRSGIADYSAELVPALAAYYDIELVVEQDKVEDARLAAFPQRSIAWLREHAHELDHVLYHFGNSPAHRHMFELIREVPGVVVLHDFFVSAVLDMLEHEGYLPLGFPRALYESHGYTGLLDLRERGRIETIWKYPLNKGVLDNAAGVIVHSEFPRTLARAWYGENAADDWRTVPLLRSQPDDPPGARAAARARLKLAANDYLVCAFGMLGPTKLNEELLEAFLDSPLADDPHCKLAFVGENDPHDYGAALLRKIAASRAYGRIKIVGYSDLATYRDYLSSADCAVQLRAATRGETSAAVLDCLLYGIPTIVNAHGANAELPDELLLKLPDAFAGADLAAALARLRDDAPLRTALAERGKAHIRAEHAPAHAARLYAQALEHFARHSRHGQYWELVRQVAPLCPPDELPLLASAIAFNRAPLPPRQLLVDVSAIIEADLKTGIQRVVRSILLALIADPPEGFRVEPVFTTGGGRSYQYARRFGMDLVGERALTLEEAPVDLRPGDLFFGLDLFASGTTQNKQLLHTMHASGVGIYFVVFDLLPILRPEVFPFGTSQYFADYLRTVHAVSDGVLCISRAVADELIDWIDKEGLTRRAPLAIGHFHLGADIKSSAPSTGLPPDADQVLAALAARPSFLTVGTVEPRKGHAQTLAAFELLWKRGVDANVVIVGKQGWMVDKLAERMASHPEKGRRLFWLAGVSDEMLLKLYGGASALLAPSEGEGFGLPLIEAAQHDIPIIARSLPVFREVAREHAYYFEGMQAADLADALVKWLQLRAQGQAPASTGMPWLTWNQSARQVQDVLLRGRWYRILPGTASSG